MRALWRPLRLVKHYWAFLACGLHMEKAYGKYFVCRGYRCMYWDNGKENGNYRDYRGYIGIIGVFVLRAKQSTSP